MKIRSGFVSNSSSSSFIINKEDLSNNQIDMIVNHIEISKNISELEYTHEADRWKITVDDEFVNGSTYMDNFDMEYFLTNVVKIDISKIKFEE